MRSRNWIWAVSSSIIVLSMLLAACVEPEDGIPEAASPEATPTPQVEELSGEGMGVRVILPWQGDIRIIQELEFDPPDTTDDDTCGAEFIQAFINFEILDGDEEPVNVFDPPMTLVVEYTSDIAARAQGAENLLLGFFDEEGGIWKAIAQGETRIDTGAMTGTVDVEDWGDRTGCWCRR